MKEQSTRAAQRYEVNGQGVRGKLANAGHAEWIAWCILSLECTMLEFQVCR